MPRSFIIETTGRVYSLSIAEAQTLWLSRGEPAKVGSPNVVANGDVADTLRGYLRLDRANAREDEPLVFAEVGGGNRTPNRASTIRDLNEDLARYLGIESLTPTLFH